MKRWDGDDRRTPQPLSDEQIEHIAEKAAEKAIEKMTAHVYREIGKSVVNKALAVLGAGVVALSIYLAAKGMK